MVLIEVEFTVLPEKRDEFLAASVAAAGPSRSDPGCLGYGFYTSVAQPDVFLLVERWADDPSLEAHAESPHIREFLDRTADLVSDRQATVYDVASTR